MMPMSLGEASQVAKLAERLRAVEGISKFDRSDREEAVVLARALSDIEGSCRAVVLELLPSALKASSDAELLDTLWSLREELRHIYYHVKDSGFLRLYVADVDGEESQRTRLR